MPRRPRLRIAGLLLAVLSAAGAANGESLVAAGYQEAVFSVSDARGYRDMLTTLAGWETVHEGNVDSVLLAGWGLPEAATARDAIFVVLYLTDILQISTSVCIHCWRVVGGFPSVPQHVEQTELVWL